MSKKNASIVKYCNICGKELIKITGIIRGYDMHTGKPNLYFRLICPDSSEKVDNWHY